MKHRFYIEIVMDVTSRNCTLSCLGTCTAIKRGGLTLVLLVLYLKKSLTMPAVKSEAVNRKRTELI
jgi:hypothetical protein